MDTESRSSTPELESMNATASVDPSAHEGLLPPLSSHPLIRGIWRNLSVIFESSESTNSLSNDSVQPNKSTTKPSEPLEHSPTSEPGSGDGPPSISPAASKSTESTETNVAEKIAYFERSLCSGATSTTSAPSKSFLSSPHEARRRSLPAVLNTLPPSVDPSVSNRPSHGDISHLGTVSNPPLDLHST